MTLSSGEKDRIIARLCMEGYDPAAVQACVSDLSLRDKNITSPLGYLRRMLQAYAHDKEAGTKAGVTTSAYDPAYWERARLVGDLRAWPPECMTCGWWHQPSEPHGELCYCGNIHPVGGVCDRPRGEAALRRADARLRRLDA